MTTATANAAPVGQRSLFREILAVLLITVGSVIPVIAWLVGIALVWSSERWRVGEKLLATLVWPLGYFAVMLAGLLPASGGSCVTTSGTTTCQHFGPADWVVAVIVVVFVAAPLLVGGYLLIRARQRARLSPG